MEMAAIIRRREPPAATPMWAFRLRTENDDAVGFFGREKLVLVAFVVIVAPLDGDP
jgi:hypothetical protein